MMRRFVPAWITYWRHNPRGPFWWTCKWCRMEFRDPLSPFRNEMRGLFDPKPHVPPVRRTPRPGTFRCEHMSIAGVISASCGTCGPLKRDR